LKKETLINNLKRIVDNIPKLDLPAEVTSIYAFGSILREKKNPHDIDLFIRYTMTPEQIKRWERFEKNFSTCDNNGNSIRKLEKYLLPYQARRIPLNETVKNEELANILRQHGIEPTWAGCFSWTRVLGYNPYGFRPSIETVMRKMIFGRKAKGLQTEFSQVYFPTIEDIHSLTARNYCLGWSKEKPDVEANLLRRSIEEKLSHNTKELDHFIGQEIPRLKKNFLEAKELVMKSTVKAKIKLDMDALESKHVEIQRTGTESFLEIAEKCEQARLEMNNFQDETRVLEIIAYTLGSSDRIDYWVNSKGYSIEEYISRNVIEDSKRSYLSESRAREILRILGMPEGNIITIKRHGFGTQYELARTAEEKSRLLAEIETEKKRAKLLKIITRTVRSIDRRARIYLESSESGKPKSLAIYVDMMTYHLDDMEKNAFEEQLKKKSFKIEKTLWTLTGLKYTILQGIETSEELVEIAKKMMMYS
jgi:predicted nucleotidyltransferase